MKGRAKEQAIEYTVWGVKVIERNLIYQFEKTKRFQREKSGISIFSFSLLFVVVAIDLSLRIFLEEFWNLEYGQH